MIILDRKRLSSKCRCAFEEQKFCSKNHHHHDGGNLKSQQLFPVILNHHPHHHHHSLRSSLSSTDDRFRNKSYNRMKDHNLQCQLSSNNAIDSNPQTRFETFSRQRYRFHETSPSSSISSNGSSDSLNSHRIHMDPILSSRSSSSSSTLHTFFSKNFLTIKILLIITLSSVINQNNLVSCILVKNGSESNRTPSAPVKGKS